MFLYAIQKYKISIYRTIILSAVLYVCEFGLAYLRRKLGGGFFKIGSRVALSVQ